MTNYFFTADTHFSHKKIIEYSKRPFGDVWEMNQTLVGKWNAKVKPTDVVYHLGDFALGGLGEAWAVRKQLNGIIHLVLGNHDKVAYQMSGAWTSMNHYVELRLPGYPMIVMSHYAFRVWNKAHHGSWQLYGHSHGSLPDDPCARSFDVGVDCWNYEPLSLDEVAAVMAKKQYKSVDHHTPTIP